MSTLKVWCERCDGLGECAEVEAYPEAPVAWVDCPDCKALGYITREVVELPDGRAVVVDAGFVERMARSRYEEAHEHCESTSGDWDGEPEQARAMFRASVTLDTRALFTGGVYEAEAVGKLHVTLPYAAAREAGSELRVLADDAEATPGDLIAIGLKEVGRGKA